MTAERCRRDDRTFARDCGERSGPGEWETAVKSGMPAGTAVQPRLPTIWKPGLLDVAGLEVPLAEHADAQWR